MTISVSVLSHAFFTEKGVCRSACNNNNGGIRDTLCFPSPREQLGSSSDVDVAGISTGVTQGVPVLPGSSSSHSGKKRGNRKRGSRGSKQNSAQVQEKQKEKELHKMSISLPMTEINNAVSSACSSPFSSTSALGVGLAEVLVRDIREECASALGIVKEDLEVFGLCHLPHTAERARLLKDKSGVMHIGVMVRNSDLNLQTIEKLIAKKTEAEEEVESCRAQINEKTEDLCSFKLKYEKLAEEVLRLRTMVNRANHLRKESEKATEILRIEFEKLVKSLFLDYSAQHPDESVLRDPEEDGPVIA